MTDQQPQDEKKLDVNSIVPIPNPADPKAGATFYLLETQKQQLEKQQLENDALRQDAGHRGRWSGRLFPLCAGWLLAVVGILLLEGFHFRGFNLDNSVIIAFIGTTTADVLGLGYIVVKYLFR